MACLAGRWAPHVVVAIALVLALSNMTATANQITSDGRPRTVTFRFAAPLESPEWLWMRGSGSRFVEWAPPQVGDTVVVATATFWSGYSSRGAIRA